MCRTTSDAVYVLNAIARLMRASPYKNENSDWTKTHADYLKDITSISNLFQSPDLSI